MPALKSAPKVYELCNAHKHRADVWDMHIERMKLNARYKAV